MFPLGFVIGALAGATAVLVVGSEVALRARPIAKAALKATLMAVHEAQVRSAEITEAAEDLYAEAKAEVTAEVFGAMMAAAHAKTDRSDGQTASAKPSTTKAARRRTAVKRSRALPTSNG